MEADCGVLYSKLDFPRSKGQVHINYPIFTNICNVVLTVYFWYFVYHNVNAEVAVTGQ